MNGEFRIILENYIAKIKEEIESLKQKRISIQGILPDAEISNEQLREYVDAGKRITELKEKLEKFNDIEVIIKMKSDLSTLTRAKTSESVKNSIMQFFNSTITYYNREICRNASMSLGSKTGFNIENAADFEKAIANFENEIKAYETALEALHTYGSKEKIMETIKEKEKDIEVLKKYKKSTKSLKAEIEELFKAIELIDVANSESQKIAYEENTEILAKYKAYYESLIDIENFSAKLVTLSSKDTAREDKKAIIAELSEELNKMEDYQIAILRSQLDEETLKELDGLTESKKEEEPVIEDMEEQTEKEKEEVPPVEEGKKEEENNGYRMTGDKIVDNSLIVAPQRVRKETPRLEGNDHARVIDVEYEPVKEKKTLSDYIYDQRRKIIAVLVGAIGISAVVLAYVSGKKKGNSNTTPYSQVEVYDYPVTNEYPMENAPVEVIVATPALTNVPEYIQMMQNVDGNIVSALINKGYSEISAPYMANSFTEETIQTLINDAIPYDARVEKYAKTTGFNYNYIDDYDNALNTYGITPENSVEYVNRAHRIFDYNLLPEADINKIVEVIMAIDNKDLFTQDNADLSTLISRTMADVDEHVVFEAYANDENLRTTDINKMFALRYLARANSDLGNFLTGYSDLAVEAIRNPYDTNINENAYKYLRLFVHSVNGYDNGLYNSELIEGSTAEDYRTGDETFDNNAKVEDAFDWYFAYKVIVNQGMPIFAPAIDGSEEAFQRWDDLAAVADTALGTPQFEAICGKARTLESGE